MQLQLPPLPALTYLDFAGQKLEGSAALPEPLTTMASLRVTGCCTKDDGASLLFVLLQS